MIRSRSRRLSAVFAFLAVSAAPLAAQGLTGFNVFTSGNFTQTNTEVNGRLAVGGAFGSLNSSVGKSLTSIFTNGSLVVGGAASVQNGTLFQGNGFIAGSRSISNFTIATGVLNAAATPLPVDFVSEFTRLKALSNSYSAMPISGVATVASSQLFFYGTNAGANVFTVTQAQLQAANGGYNFYAPAGGSIIVNVTGIVDGGQFFANTGFAFCTSATNATTFGGCTQGNNDSPPSLVSKLLWNVNSATAKSITFGGSMRGSFLAPNISITAASGSCIGDFVAANINSACEFYNDPYTGYVPPTTSAPEPSSFALAFAGLVSLAAVARRKRVKNS